MTGEGAPEWWERLGGPNAISLPAWLLTLPGGVVASLAWLPRDANVDLTAAVGVSLLSHVLTGAILYVAWLTYLSPRPRRSRPWALVGTLLVAGAARGAFLAEATAAIGIVATAPVLGRAVGTALAVTLWFSLATLIVDATRRHRSVMAGLRSELTREQMLAARSAALVRDFRATQIRTAQAVVAEQFEIAAALSDDPALIAAHLHSVAHDVVRPLSHEFERRSLADAAVLDDVEDLSAPQRPPLRDYLVGIVTDRPFAPLVTAVVLVATPLVVTLTALGPLVGAVMLATAGLTMFAALSLARRSVAQDLRRWPVPARAVVVITVWGSSTALTALLLGGVAVATGADPDAWLTSSSVATVQSTLVVAAAMALCTMLAAAVEGAVEGQRRRTESDLRLATRAVEWAHSRLRQQLWSEQRRMSRVLHGDVQSRLVAVAVQLTDRTGPDTSAVIGTLARDLRTALDLADDQDHSWRDSMDDVQSLWQLAVDLAVFIDPSAGVALDGDPVAGQAVVAVVGEALRNAVQHGKAGTVTVALRESDGAIEVSVTDDGRLSADPAPGMGSRILDDLCLDWSLVDEGTTTLRARVACRPTSLGQPQGSA